MSARGTLKQVLKRGALITVANWPVVLVQFVADALFKALLAIPLVGGGLLVVLVVGGDPADIFSRDLRRIVPEMAGVLLAQPVALAAFLLALLLILAGGSLLMYFVKGGTITVLLEGDRQAGAVEQPPLRVAALRRADAFSIDRFIGGARDLFGRYLVLGLCLCLAYGLSAAAYFSVILKATPADNDTWTIVAALASLALIAWITLVNFVYALFQVVIAAEGCDVRSAPRRVAVFLRREGGVVLLVFAAILALVTLTTAASILATAALGLLAFVPLVSLAALPLQVLAWLLRGVVFQYIGLTAVSSYVRLYRATDVAGALDEQRADDMVGPIVPRSA